MQPRCNVGIEKSGDDLFCYRQKTDVGLYLARSYADQGPKDPAYIGR